MPTPKNKRKFALWLYPETLDKIGQLYTADDCCSKSEFIEKAVQFYIDHLTAEDQRSMLPNAMLSSMKSIVAESDNRISRLLFKMAVELAVTMNVVAANSDIDDITLERLKGECVKEVKRLNGNFTFRGALKVQSREILAELIAKINGGTYDNPQVEDLLQALAKRLAVTNGKKEYGYLLNRRGIDREVLSAFVHKGMIYESADYHNAVFVGYDEKGIARHAHKRGTGSESTYKGNAESCDPRYSFHWTGTDNTLYLFEAPIDMLSFISLHKENWRSHSYAAACCVGDQVLFQMLKANPNIDTVCLCMDNDAAGQTANKRISDKLFIQGIKHEILVPTHKDWNEDLLYDKQDETECQTLQL